MRSLVFIALIYSSQTFASQAAAKLQSPDLYIDGTVKEKSEVVLEKVAVEDDELKFFKNELDNVKNLNKSFKQKSKTLAKMAEEAEQLKEQHLDYMENRIEWESTIDEYNKQADCMAKNPKECSKFLGRDHKKRNRGDGRATRQNSPIQQEFVEEIPLGFNELAPVQIEKSTSFDQRKYVESVDSVIAANADLLSDCLSRYASNARDFAVVYAQLSINSAGSLSHLGIENPEAVPNRQVLSCVSSVLHSLAYPAASKDMKIRKPFSFVIRRS